MRIPDLSTLPAITTKAEWARIFEISVMKLSRGEGKKLLTGTRPNSRTVLYKREDVLRFLGVL